jgi:maltooligosyltrehalose trehalohydrolase
MTRVRGVGADAERVDLVVGEERRAMRPEGAGCGGTGVVDAGRAGPGPGDDYAFSLDGGPPRPDPRSGGSRTACTGRAGCRTPGRAPGRRPRAWLARVPSAVGRALRAAHRDVHAGRDVRRGHRRLDHVVELGATAISLMPVNAFPGRTAGATTAWRCTRSTSRTAGRRAGPVRGRVPRPWPGRDPGRGV